MMQDISGEKIPIPVNISALGDNIVIAAQPTSWIYVFEVIGDLSGASTMSTKAGAIVLENFALSQDQGITITAVGNLLGEPRYKVPPGNAFIINLTPAASFVGGCVYALKS